MSPGNRDHPDLSSFSMTELFRIDAENQLVTLSEGMLALGGGMDPAPVLEELMRAAHSLKGAARVVGADQAAGIAHAMEDVFVKAQQRNEALSQAGVDLMLAGVDLLQEIIFEKQPAPTQRAIDQFVQLCGMDFTVSGNANAVADSSPPASFHPPAPAAPPSPASPFPVPAAQAPAATGGQATAPEPGGTRSLRIGSENLDRLVALAGEARIALNRASRIHKSASRLEALLRNVRNSLKNTSGSQSGSRLAENPLATLEEDVSAFSEGTAKLLADLEEYGFQASLLGNRLYSEALACRMRPFSDCVPALRRSVRDLSRSLGKPCQFEVIGESVDIDRDILEKLESTLIHLVRNALDHGIESPAERSLMGKPAESTVTIEAAHVAGRLVIRVGDDGRGIDTEGIRQQIVARGLVSPAAAPALSVQEVMEFLFLPGFSMSEKVTEISGRGVGLDAVRVVARNLRGTVRITSSLGDGTTFELSMPVSQALARCLLVDVAGTPCGVPLSRVEGVFTIPDSEISSTEGRQHCEWNGHRVGLVNAAQILDLEDSPVIPDPLHVFVLADAGQRFGIVVTGFLGEEELLLQPMDPQMGKIRDLAATALLPDGTPALVLDDEDFLLSARNLAQDGKLRPSRPSFTTAATTRKRVLVVDDSLTVRELERKLLSTRGYEVTTAVDGMDGWNTLRENSFDLVITDVDMPRMDGIELVEKIRANPHYRDLPVMIVSYKDRPEDRQRGMDAGADYYLAKSSFHSDELALRVEELIGDAVNP